MKKSILIGTCIIAVMASCGSKEVAMTESEKKAKADSLVGVKIEELNKEAMEDFDRRQTIEVKQKADSIVEAYKQANAK